MAIESFDEQRWYQVPLLWLSLAVFSALVAGCIAVIMLARTYSDEAFAVQGERLLKVPTSQAVPSPDSIRQ